MRVCLGGMYYVLIYNTANHRIVNFLFSGKNSNTNVVSTFSKVILDLAKFSPGHLLFPSLTAAESIIFGRKPFFGFL